jgi:transposase
MNNYIGIDVASQTLQVYDGKKNVEVPNSEKLLELRHLLQEAFPKDWKKVRLLYEPTGVYSSYVEQFALRYSIQAFAINPKRSSNFAKALGNRSKTDPIDAKMLYEYHKLVADSEWKIPEIDKDLDALTHNLSTYEFLQMSHIQMRNHLHALSRGKTVDAASVEFLEKEIDRLKKQEEAMVIAMEKKTKACETTKEDFARLTSIPGIGPLSAIVLLMMFRKYPETNRAEMTALMGLDPIRRISGTTLHKRDRISKEGYHFARKILYMGAVSSIRHDNRIKVYYEHLIDNHKPPKVALIACMRKLVLIAHQIYTKKEYYKTNL